MRQLLLRLPPSDRTVMALLLLAVVVAALRWPVLGSVMAGYVLLHVGLLVAFSAVAYFLARHEQSTAVPFVRPLATVAVIFTLYTSLGKLGLAAMPYTADAALSRIDTGLFGVDPSLWIQRYQSPGWIEFFSFFYGAFIPYIYLSLTLNCLGRPPGEREPFLTGWVFTYSLSYLGYLFLPAHGPIVYHAADYHVSLAGNYFYKIVLDGVHSSGGDQGAFPSLHGGGSLYLCLYDLRVNRLRGLTFLPLVILIYVATIFLRYHYVIDLIAGTAIAAGCIPLGQWAFRHWSQRRKAAGLPPLPGEGSDALPILSGAGPAGAAHLLPAN
jgi:membrane-associated phospholipid phosphatase